MRKFRRWLRRRFGRRSPSYPPEITISRTKNRSRRNLFPQLRRLLRWLLGLIGRGLWALFSLLGRALNRLRHFLVHLLGNILRSLWFRVAGAYAVVLLILLIIVMNSITSLTARQFSQYIADRNDYYLELLPTLLPDDYQVTRVIIRADSIQVEGERQSLTPIPSATPTASLPLTENQPIPEMLPPLPTLAPLPTLPALPTLPPLELPIFFVDASGNRVYEPLLPPSTADIAASPPRTSYGIQFLLAVEEQTRTAFFIAGLISLIIGTVVFWQITRPLAQIRHATQAIAGGDIQARVPVKSRDELGRVATAFNEMATQLEKQENVRQQMVADVAHELRTPLTVMKSNLEAMMDGLLEPNMVELGELLGEVERLSRMTDDLRLLSLADAGRLRLDRQKMDACQLIDTIILRYTPLAVEHGVELLGNETAVPLYLYADYDKLHQALRNLVENALRYTPAGGRVRLTAVRDAAAMHLSVIDTGRGIPADELPRLFDRFWRGDRSRSRHSGGSGLGLAIVKKIVDLHQGTIRAVSPAGGGTIFTITLPLQKPRESGTFSPS